jgi:opacity protein-like surface antigen
MKMFLIAASLLTSIAHAATPSMAGIPASSVVMLIYLATLIKTNAGVTRSNSSYQSGFDAGGNLGFKSNPLRYEGELSYIKANINKFNINHIEQTDPSGYSNAVMGLANVYYDFLGFATASIQPYLGAGIGYAFVQDKLSSTEPYGVNHFTGANSVFAYQATGGLTYNFAENYALNLGYRYLATTHVADLGQSFQAHIANIGAVYRFDGNNYK